MRSTRQLSITLPVELASTVHAKVETGEYASESEVVREGLRALLARDRAVEQWLSAGIAAAYDELQAHPSRALSAEQVRSSLAAARRRTRRK